MLMDHQNNLSPPKPTPEPPKRVSPFRHPIRWLRQLFAEVESDSDRIKREAAETRERIAKGPYHAGPGSS